MANWCDSSSIIWQIKINACISQYLLKVLDSHCENWWSYQACDNSLLKIFSYVGIPKIIKMNESVYISKAFQKFCYQWKIEHKTDIPYNPKGQEIVEPDNGTFKTKIQKIKKGSYIFSHHIITWINLSLVYISWIWMPTSNLLQTDFKMMALQ